MQGAPLDVPAILERFQGVARLFPLPSVVLFPDAVVPLKIFEPRYVAMVRDAIEDDHLIALALFKPGWDKDYEGKPPIHPVICVGRILKFNELENGDFDLLLYGLARARIEEELPSEPFRTARVTILEESSSPAQADVIARRMRRALDMVPGRQTMIWDVRRVANRLRGVDASPGRYADAVANAGDLPPEARYELLAESDVLRRLEGLIGHLEHRAYADAPTPIHPRDPRRN